MTDLLRITAQIARMPRFANSAEVGPLTKNQDELRAKIAELREQHRELDAEIDDMVAAGNADQINLQRLKKQKLHLKDQISTLENQLLPDIIA